MKILIVLGFLAFSVSAATKVHPGVKHVERGFIENIINNTINDVLASLPEPIVLENVALNFPDGSLIEGNASITNTQLSGLKGLVIQSLTVDLSTFSLDFTAVVPVVNLFTDYEADLLFGTLIPLYGLGTVNAHLTDLVITGQGAADLSTGIQVKDLKVYLALGTGVFDIHGLLYDEAFSAIISAILNDVVPNFINTYQDLISSILSPIVQNILNAILGGGATTTPAPVY